MNGRVHGHAAPESQSTSLAAFLQARRDEIVDDWQRFAEQIPAAVSLSREKLRGHVEQTLSEVVQYLDAGADDHAPALSSRLADHSAADAESAAQVHGSQRVDDGFPLDDLIAEYRALRRCVLRHWRDTAQHHVAQLDDLVRFDIALDRALGESVSRYMARVNRSRELFLGILGHDMRSPLGAIRMSAQVLLESASGPAQAAAAQRVLRSSERLLRILGDLLDAAQARLGGALPVTPTDADLDEIARQIADEMNSLYRSDRIRIDRAGALRGRWDPARLAQLLSNLLENAIKYGDQGTPVALSLDGTARESVRLDVHNQGPPIPLPDSAVVFDPLVRLASGRERQPDQGLGLGLYIARAIVDAHGGTIAVESSAGHGTVFRVVLPRDASRARVESRRHPG